MTNNEIIISNYSWAAGIIDGEGCVYIKKSTPTKGAKNFMYSAYLRVCMTHMPTIKRLYEIFGGSYHERKNKQWKQQAYWEVSSLKCKDVLLKIIDFLYTKKDEAKLVIDFLNLPKANHFKETPIWLLNERERLYINVRDLKQYNFEITTKKEIKLLKKDVKTNCSVCGQEISAYHINGKKRTVCSNECKFKSKRILTDEQEKMLFDDYKTGLFSYNNLSKKYIIKRGTVGWIIDKYKN